MNTRAKQNIAIITASVMMILNVFSKPLHIPAPAQAFLIFGAFIPLVFLFRYNKKLKQERESGVENRSSASGQLPNPRTRQRNLLLLGMVLGIIVSLASPFWLPITGTTLGMRGDFVVGLITAAILCVIFGIRLRKL